MCFISFLLAVSLWTYYFSTLDNNYRYACLPYTPSLLLLLWWGFSHPNLSALLQSISLVSSLLPFIFIFTGWTVYHQTSERVTYKSSSKPRTRFLSGPVSLSICLYFFLFYFQSLYPSSFYSTFPSYLSALLFLVHTVPHLNIYHSYFFHSPFLSTSSNVVLLCCSDHQGI